MRILHGIPLSIVLVIMAASSISCDSTGLSTVTGSNSQKTVTVTDQNNNGTVSLSKGDELVVTLTGNPSTGYQWQQSAADAAVIRQIGESEFTSDSSAIGSPGKVTLRYKAVGQGQTTLKLSYQRSFEPDTPPVQTFQITVEVS